MSKPILEINGFTSKVDILTSIKEDIENGNKDNAIDNLNQLIDYETKPIEDENGMSIGQGRLW
jgi:hypothetical protein|tara:strand:- start:632 stop:820 length:189 start_codon:yes stop_codon:yes gene_type:complete